jgi:hypothetical protein
MNKTLALGFVTLAVAAGVIGMTTITTTYNVQTAEAKSERDDNFGQNAASAQATDGVGNPRNTANGNGLTANSDDHLSGKDNNFGGIVSGCAKTTPHCG